MSRTNTVTTLAALRLAVGVASWATPRAAGRAFGLDADANPQSPYLARLFVAGARGGYLPKLTSVLVTATAVTAAALGVAALRDAE